KLREAFNKLELIMDGEPAIYMADPAFKAIVDSLWDADRDGYITEAEASVRRVINTEFRGNTDLVDASPLKHFHWVAYNGDAATFYGCSSLKKISIREDSSFVSNMFAGCTALEEVELPSSISRLSEYKTGSMFNGCSSLRNITLPSDMTEIGGNMFLNCISLEELDIPATVTTIGYGATNGCTSLKRIINRAINVSVYTGNNAFANCPNLTEMIILQETPPTLGYGSFYNTDNCIFYVKDTVVNTYKSASGWSGMASRIKPLSSYTKDY
ncbi:leucine-rich repeat domain-containing protein, partial [Bacteroides cellulosilyticus]|uniref:leucine-rich repeat domain-containing protein n=2 Tax=Bacteroides TaxID=816 RepID=UPI001D09421A